MVYESAWEKFKGNEKMKPPSQYYTPVRLPSVLHQKASLRVLSYLVEHSPLSTVAGAHELKPAR